MASVWQCNLFFLVGGVEEENKKPALNPSLYCFPPSNLDPVLGFAIWLLYMICLVDLVVQKVLIFGYHRSSWDILCSHLWAMLNSGSMATQLGRMLFLRIEPRVAEKRWLSLGKTMVQFRLSYERSTQVISSWAQICILHSPWVSALTERLGCVQEAMGLVWEQMWSYWIPCLYFCWISTTGYVGWFSIWSAVGAAALQVALLWSEGKKISWNIHKNHFPPDAGLLDLKKISISKYSWFLILMWYWDLGKYLGNLNLFGSIIVYGERTYRV